MKEFPGNYFNNGFKESPDKGGNFSDENKGYEKEEYSLTQKVTEVPLINLSNEKISRLRELYPMYEAGVASFDGLNATKVINEFIQTLANASDIGLDALKTCALYYLLIGQGIPADIERFDLDDSELETFIRNGFK